MGKVSPDVFGLMPGETPIDPSKLRKGAKRIKTRGQLNAAEAKNVLRAHMKYLVSTPSEKRAPFTLDWTAKLHAEMFGDLWTWAGKFRQIDLAGVGSRCFNVQVELRELLRDLRAWRESDMPLIEQAATLHHRSVLIHPFENGNGRWSRLLANILLRQHGSPVVAWPETDMVGCASSIRGQYIAALKQADQGDMESLLRLHERYLRTRPSPEA